MLILLGLFVVQFYAMKCHYVEHRAAGDVNERGELRGSIPRSRAGHRYRRCPNLTDIGAAVHPHRVKDARAIACETRGVPQEMRF
jgi:hypothetical protein